MAKIKTILFAEDDQVLLAAYRPHLKRAGYNVIPASDGLETLKNLSMLVPDLLILDLMMPKFDGEELLQYIANTPRLSGVPVIVFSSKCVVDAEQEHLIMRADRYLIKQDCNPNLLLEAVKELLASEFHVKPAGKIPTTKELSQA
jgi:DNA-binding response OmpR family regulator